MSENSSEGTDLNVQVEPLSNREPINFGQATFPPEEQKKPLIELGEESTEISEGDEPKPKIERKFVDVSTDPIRLTEPFDTNQNPLLPSQKENPNGPASPEIWRKLTNNND